MRRNTWCRLYFRGFHGKSFQTRFDRLNSWHVFIRSTFPSLLEWIPPWKDDVVPRERERNYRCHECTRARQLLPGALRPVTVTATALKFFNFQASKLESHPLSSERGCVPLAEGQRGREGGHRGTRHANPGAVPMQVSVATSSVISFAIKRLWSLPWR